MIRLSLIGFLLIALGGFPTAGGEPTAPEGSRSFSVSGAVPDPGAGMLFGTSDWSPSDLLAIDPLTGVGTLIGPILDSGENPDPGPPPPATIDALATDPFTGFVYGSGFAVAAPRLYRINPLTGAATRIGETTLGVPVAGDFTALDARADGTLFAALHSWRDRRRGGNHLAMFDIATGDEGVIGPFGECPVPGTGGPGSACTIEGITALAFDTAGTLWAAQGDDLNGDIGLYTVDPTTGAATFVGPILNAGGDPASGGIQSMQFGCDGTLYGGTGTAVGAAMDGGRLVTIDRNTQEFDFVGAGPATPSGEGLLALAFSMSHCAPVDSINALVTDLDALVAIGTLDHAVAKPLQNLLNLVARVIERGNVHRGKVGLRVVQLLVLAGERSGRIPEATAAGLQAALQRIIGAL